MNNISVPSDEWVDINTLSGIDVGDYFLLTNNSSPCVRFQITPTKPLDENKDGYPLCTDKTIEIASGSDTVWAKASYGVGYIYPQTVPNITPFQSGLPQDILTSEKEGIRRLQVDPSQTGFWDNREFRIFEPIDTSGGDVTIRIVAGVDFILRWQALVVQSDDITMKAYRLSDGGTDSGTWTDTIYKLRNNTMSDAPSYTPQVSYQTGGSFVPTDPDLYRDILATNTANATAQQSTVGASSVPERGLPPDTYYLIFTGGGVGDFFSIIEERP